MTECERSKSTTARLAPIHSRQTKLVQHREHVQITSSLFCHSSLHSLAQTNSITCSVVVAHFSNSVMYQTNQQVYNTSNTNPTPSQLQQQQAQNIIIAPSDPTTTATTQYIDYSHLNNSHVNNNNYNYKNHEQIHQYQSTPSANHFLSPPQFQQHSQHQYAYPMETTPIQSLKPRPFQEFEQYHRTSPLEQRNYMQQQQQQQQNKQEKSLNLSSPDSDEASGSNGNNGTNSEVKPPVGQGGGKLGRVFRYFFATNLMHPYHDKKPEEYVVCLFVY